MACFTGWLPQSVRLGGEGLLLAVSPKVGYGGEETMYVTGSPKVSQVTSESGKPVGSWFNLGVLVMAVATPMTLGKMSKDELQL